MDAMGDSEFSKPKQIQTTEAANAAFVRFVGKVQGLPSVRWKGKPPNQQAAFSAVWFWLEQMDPAQLAEGMSLGMARLEASMKEGAQSKPKPGLVAEDLRPPESDEKEKRKRKGKE